MLGKLYQKFSKIVKKINISKTKIKVHGDADININGTDIDNVDGYVNLVHQIITE